MVCSSLTAPLTFQGPATSNKLANGNSKVASGAPPVVLFVPALKGSQVNHRDAVFAVSGTSGQACSRLVSAGHPE